MQATAIATTPIPGHYWSWRGQSVYYVQAGQRRADRPPLVLLHGFGASTDHWRKTIAGLQEHWEVWAIDLLGFGRASKPNWQYSGALWCDQLRDFMTEVVQQPGVIAGNSLGGYVALCVGAECSDLVRGVILLNSAGPFTESDPLPPPNPLRAIVGQTIQTLFRQDWASFLLFKYVQQRSIIRKTLSKVYLDQAAVTEQLVEEIYRPSCDPGASQVFASVFRTPQGRRVDDLLAHLSQPLLLLWGEADPWMNARSRSLKFRQYYPHLTEHFLRAGHCPHDEVPDQVNQLMADWILQDVVN